MKLSKLASSLILTVGVSSFGVYAANNEVGGGSITFTGSIIDAACSISPDFEDQEVSLGQIASAQLENGGKSTPRTFSIQLENCSLAADTGTGNGADDGAGGNNDDDDDTDTPGAASRATAANTVSVTFNGAADSTNPDLLGLSGNASGAGVAITDAGGSILKLGTPSSAFNLTEGRNTLDFAAYLQGAGRSTAIETGEFTSIANFTLNYE